MRRPLALTACFALGLAALAGCGDDDGTSASGDRPTVAVTTNILADVVTHLVGEAAEVEVIMPAGADPHEFQASARQVQQMATADALVTNGADFEEGLVDAIEGAESDGVPTFHAIDAVETIDFGAAEHGHEGDEDEHAEEEDGEPHSEEEGEEGHDHGHEGVDPHFFTDPARMAEAAEGIADFLAAEVPALATEGVRQDAEAYLDELRALDASVEETLAAIPDEARVLITNHEVFGYFADRYDFEVVGVVVPGGTTGGEADAANLAELAELIDAEGVPAVFVDTSAPSQLADNLAAEAGGDVEVVALFSESLGDEGSGGETYVEMVTTNAERIAAALA